MNPSTTLEISQFNRTTTADGKNDDRETSSSGGRGLQVEGNVVCQTTHEPYGNSSLDGEEKISGAQQIEDSFYGLLGGHIFFQALFAAVELSLFEILDEKNGLAAEGVAQVLGIEQQPANILLLPLAATGLVKQVNGLYYNTAMTEEFLLKRSPRKYTACVQWQGRINYTAMKHFLGALKCNANIGLQEIPGNGTSLYERLSSHPELLEIFQAAMQEISQQSNPLLVDALDLSSKRLIIDVGGGNGTNLIRLCRANPNLKGVIFDLATVREIAEKNIASEGLSDRISFVPGNIFSDPLPVGADAVLYCHFFTIWSPEENLKLLRKASDALRPGGATYIFNMMQHDTGDGPMTAALGSPYFLTIATGRGMLYKWCEYEELFERAAFSGISRKKLPNDHGVITGIKA